MMNNDHTTHDPAKYPVEGCPDCDKFIGRPILKGFGEGKSNTVIERKETDAGA